MNEKQDTLPYVEDIHEYLDAEEVLAQLAEEAVELAHAALKLRRALESSVNPTPVTQSAAWDNLREEFGDVYACAAVLFNEQDHQAAQTIAEYKLMRWALRLEREHG